MVVWSWWRGRGAGGRARALGHGGVFEGRWWCGGGGAAGARMGTGLRGHPLRTLAGVS